MHAKSFVSVLVCLSLALLLGIASLRAQEATPQAADVIAQFGLSQTYQDDLYTLNIPEGWVTQAAPGAVALATSQRVNDLAMQFGLPRLTTGQIAVEIMSGVIDSRLRPDAPIQIVNVNCTSCHVLGKSVAPVNEAEIAPSLNKIADSVAHFYHGAPLHFTFGDAQATKLDHTDAVEVAFTSQPVDGLLIEFYANGQLVNFLAMVSRGELAKQQSLLEAIASTIQLADIAPAAVSTDSP